MYHHVLYSLRDDESGDAQEVMISGLRTLSGIRVVKGLHIGVPDQAGAGQFVNKDYDVSALLFFENNADLKEFKHDPIHVEFIRTCSPLIRKVEIIDVEECLAHPD